MAPDFETSHCQVDNLDERKAEFVMLKMDTLPTEEHLVSFEVSNL